MEYDQFAEVLSSPIPAEVYAAVDYVLTLTPKGSDIYSIARTVVKGWGNDVEIVLHWPEVEDYLHVSVLVSFTSHNHGVVVEEATVKVDGEYEVDGFIQSAERTAGLDLKTGILTWIGTGTQVKDLIEEAKATIKAN